MGFSHPFLEHPLCNFDKDFNVVTVYEELCQDLSGTYDPSKTKDLYLWESNMKYINRFLAYSFSGCKDALSILSKTKLYFLWSIVLKRRLNLGF